MPLQPSTGCGFWRDVQLLYSVSVSNITTKSIAWTGGGCIILIKVSVESTLGFIPRMWAAKQGQKHHK